MTLYVHTGWGLQALEHSVLARELLSVCSSISSFRGEKHEMLTCLLSIHLTRGGAALLTAKYPFAWYVFILIYESEQKSTENCKVKMSLTLFYS